VCFHVRKIPNVSVCCVHELEPSEWHISIQMCFGEGMGDYTILSFTAGIRTPVHLNTQQNANHIPLMLTLGLTCSLFWSSVRFQHKLADTGWLCHEQQLQD